MKIPLYIAERYIRKFMTLSGVLIEEDVESILRSKILTSSWSVFVSYRKLPQLVDDLRYAVIQPDLC